MCPASGGVDVSTVIKVRKLVKDASLASLAASKPGRPRPVNPGEVEELRVENARLTEAVKELAIELSLVRGKAPVHCLLAWEEQAIPEMRSAESLIRALSQRGRDLNPRPLPSGYEPKSGVISDLGNLAECCSERVIAPSRVPDLPIALSRAIGERRDRLCRPPYWWPVLALGSSV